jgi:hypothetical protein
MGGECEESHKKRDGSLQRAHLSRRGSGAESAGEVPPIVHDVLRSPGQPLDPEARTFFEPRFGQDFSQVRVHTDMRSAGSARAVSALAYTVGRNVVFAAGHYSPATSTGRKLLAHELTHVVQQSNSSCSLKGISSPADPGEREAEKVASAHLEMEPLHLKSPRPIPLLLRQEDPTLPPVGSEIQTLGPEPPPEQETPASPIEEKPLRAASTDAFGKECPDSVVLQDKKAIPAYNKKMFDAGFKTYFGLVSNMKVGPNSSYEACITEVLKTEENTCGDKGNMADYEPCTPKKHCMKVGEACGGDVLTDTKFACSSTTFVDLHRTQRDASLLEGSGKTECKAKCLQRYGCGGKEIGRFYITRNFKAGEFNDGKKKNHITTGSIEKEPVTK